MKQTRNPTYVRFMRYGVIEGKWPPDFKNLNNGVNSLDVPLLLISTFSNPNRLAEEVRELELCDIVGAENPHLVVNEERTREERRKLILNAPRVMRTGRGAEEKHLYVRTDNSERLCYARWDRNLIEPWNSADYIASADAAEVYLKSLCADKSRIEEGDYFKLVKQRSIPTPYKETTLRLYLLSEINEIAGRVS